MKRGELHRRLRWKPIEGPTVELRFTRFASLDNPHALAVRIQIRALDKAATVVVRPRLDGQVENNGVLHWRQMEQGEEDETVFLCAQTRRDNHAVIEAMRVQEASIEESSVEEAGVEATDVQVGTEYSDLPRTPGSSWKRRCNPAQLWTVDKVVALFTDRDGSDFQQAACTEVESLAAGGFERLRAQNRAAWEKFWEDSDVIIEGDDEAQQAIRHALFQLRIAAPSHEDRVSIGAKSLSGFGYRGHVFWDTETFMLPLFTFTQPALARNLLMYRWHTIEGARRKAAAGGFEGAQFAWESAETGDEVTPRWVVPHIEGVRWPTGDSSLIRIWCGDIELHITSDIVYAIWQYWCDHWRRRFHA